MSKYPKTPETCLQAMIEWRQLNTTNKQRTLDFYSETLSAVFRIMDSIECHMIPYQTRTETTHRTGTIDESDIKKIIAYMQKADLAIATQKGYIRALRVYCEHYGNDVVRRMHIQWPEDTRPKVDWLTTDQMRTLMEFPGNPSQQLAIQLMGRMGLRRVECIRIKMKDLQPTYITVRGKGRLSGKLRNVPLRSGMDQVLERYMAYRNELVLKARVKDPDVEVPDELFINWNQGLLRPYEEDGWGFDKAVIVPLRKELGFPFFEPYVTANIRPDAMGGRSRSADDRDDPRPQFDGNDHQISWDPHGRYGDRNGKNAILR